MSYLEQSTRYLGYDRRLRQRPLPLLPRPGGARVAARRTLRRRDGPDVRHLRRGPARPDRVAHPAVPEDARRHRLRLPPGDPRQGARRVARPAAGQRALERRDLRVGPGLRVAAAAHARPPAARGARLLAPDARRADEGHPVVPAPRGGRRARRGVDRLPRAHSLGHARPGALDLARRRGGRAGRVGAPGRLRPRGREPRAARRSSSRRRPWATPRPRAAWPRSTSSSAPTSSRPTSATRLNRRHRPGRAFERTDVPLRARDRLRRVPRPPAPPAPHGRVAAALDRRSASTCPTS